MSALSTDQQFLYVLVGIAALVVILELAGPLIWGFRVEHDRLIGCFFGLPFYDIRFADLVTVRRDGSWERLIPRFVRPKSGYGWLRPVVIITSKTGFYRTRAIAVRDPDRVVELFQAYRARAGSTRRFD